MNENKGNIPNIRIGQGYDVHQLKDGDIITLGGVKIASKKAIIAHSDGDVLIHAICDALLGSLSMSDIGYHFPDTSNDFKAIDSKILLSKTISLVREQGYEIINIDSTLVLESPKINPHVEEMKTVLGETLNCSPSQISIKATTNEKMGYVGREEGVFAMASVLVYKV